MDHDMTYIYEIYSYGSIRKAAEHLSITQPALSIALRRVEDSLGEMLFDRSKHPLSLTPAGEIYIETADRIRALEQDMYKAILDLSVLNSGTITLGATQYPSSYILPDVIYAFRKQHPAVSVSLTEDTTEANLERLMNREIDILISTREYDPRKFSVKKAVSDHLLLVVPKEVFPRELLGFAFSWEEVVSDAYLDRPCPEDLSVLNSLTYITLKEGTQIYRTGAKLCRKHRLRPESTVQVTQFVTAYSLACSGIGITFTADQLIKKAAPAEVLYLNVDPSLMQRELYMVTLKAQYLPAAVRCFLDSGFQTSR